MKKREKSRQKIHRGQKLEGYVFATLEIRVEQSQNKKEKWRKK